MKTKLFATAVVVLFATSFLAAEIELDKATLQIGNALLFKDHAEAGAYYYMPNQPRIATWPDGRPKLTFLK